MKPSGSGILSTLIVICMVAFTAWMYPQLPEQMATHWDALGHPDRLAPRARGAWALPVVTAALAVLLALIPRISPRGYTVEGSRRAFGRVRAILVAFLAFIQIALLLQATGHAVSIERSIPAAVGLMIALLGNLFGKTTKNFFVGIRTPWTLASDEVWLRTHRLGGRLFVIAGSVVFVASLAGHALPVFPIALGFAAGVPVVYSYVLYRRLEGFGPDVSA